MRRSAAHIEEAMRIGSRIGIMEGGKLIQVGTPQEIIENPANDYVRNFFNTVDTSRYLTAGQLKSDSVPLFVHNGKAPDAQTVCQQLQALDKHYAFIVDEKNTFRGSISLEKIALLVENGHTLDLEHNLLKQIDPVPEDLQLDSVIQRLVINEGPIPVIDQSGRYSGAISKGRLLSRLQGE